jgi:DNA-binding NtrC family response regulator
VVRVVLVCPDATERMLLRACLNGHHVAEVKTFKDAAKALTQAPADLVLARLDTRDSTGMDILHLMRRSQISVPVVAILPRRGTPLESEAWQMGVRTYVTLPASYEKVRLAVEKALRQAQEAARAADGPGITDAERGANLSELVNELTRKMKCPAGTNRVLIRSVIKGINQKTEPRISLRCPIRQAVGLNEYVFFEHIRDYCTGDYRACDAVIQYKRLRKANG